MPRVSLAAFAPGITWSAPLKLGDGTLSRPHVPLALLMLYGSESSTEWAAKCARDEEDGLQLHMCCGCPRAFHEQCIPQGAKRKPSRDGQSFVFLCELCAPVGWQALYHTDHAVADYLDPA